MAKYLYNDEAKSGQNVWAYWRIKNDRELKKKAWAISVYIIYRCNEQYTATLATRARLERFLHAAELRRTW